MDMVFTLLRYHWIGLALAVLVGIFMVAPELIMKESLGSNFEGIYMHASDGELFYLARMQQTYRGISAWESPFLYEYRGEFPLTYALFADSISAYPGKWLGIPVPKLNLIYKMIFSVAIFLLIYSLFFRLTRSILWSVAAGLFIMTGYRLVTLPGLIDFLGWSQTYSQFLLFSRPPTSQSTWIIFWSFLHMLLSVLRKQGWKYIIFCGIIFGLSFYSQYYIWTFLLALIGLVMAGALISKKLKLFWKMTVILGIGFIIAFPYILNLLAVVNHKYYSFYSILTFLFISREPNISKIGLFVGLLFLIYLKKSKARNPNDILILALLATTFVTTNQQVITNRLLEVGHYHWFFNIFIYILILIYLAYQISIFISKKLVTLVLVVLAVASLINGYYIQSSSYKAQTQRALNNQKYSKVFDWFNQNTSSDDVILSNTDQLSLLIPVYTHNFVYWSSAAPLYMMPPERFETPLYMYLKLYGVTPVMLGGESFFHLNPNQEQLGLASKYQNVESMLYIQFRRAYPDGMLERYEDFYRKGWEENFRLFRSDYIVYDKTISGSWNLEGIKFLKPVQEFGNIVVFENTLP